MSEEWNETSGQKIDEERNDTMEAAGREAAEKTAEEPSKTLQEPDGADNFSRTATEPSGEQQTVPPQAENAAAKNPYAQYDTNKRQDYIWGENAAGSENKGTGFYENTGTTPNGYGNPNGNANPNETTGSNNGWTGSTNASQNGNANPNETAGSNNGWTGNTNANPNGYGNPNGGWQGNGNGNGNPDRKKDSVGSMLGKIIAVAAVFGLVAGAIFFGLDRMSDFFFQGTQSSTMADSGEKKTDSIKEETTQKDAQESTGTAEILPGSGTTIRSTEVLSGEETDITDLSEIVEQVMPSVVAVSATVEQTGSYFGYYEEQPQTGTSSGSGVIYSEDGKNLYIVTNHHVISGALDVTVRFSDNSTAKAVVKGYDSDVDLAVLSVDLEELTQETKQTVRQIAIGNSDQTQVGEMVIAIGNALGYGQSMTVGYVSAKDRVVTTETGVTMTLLQTDAAINPGNSGGALLNLKGELIGITNIKYATTSVEGMGFAIPISSATSIIRELETVEELKDEERGYLGVSCEEITSTQAEMYNMPAGVYITEVAKKGAADKAGLLRGDIITAVNGTKVETRAALQNRITSKRVGTEVTITYMRTEGGAYAEHEVTVTLQGAESLDELEDSAKEESSDSPAQSDDGVDYGDYYDHYNDFYNDFFNDFFYY